MKTTMFKSLVGTGLALAAVAAVLASINTPAQEKGAQLLLRPAAVTQTTPLAAPAMSCPKCKSEFTSRVDNSVRGVNKPVITVERHLCPTCATGQVMVGTGKAAQNVTVHTCGSCGSKVASCCDSLAMGM